VDTRSDYGVVEAAYLTAIAAFAHDAGITHLTIREPGMSRNPSPLGATPQGPALAALFDSGLAGYHDGAQVSVPVALELIRGMLRKSGAWCRLEADEAFLVHIGWDQYVYVGSCEPCERALARTRELGLFTERLTASPYTASFDEPGEQHPADDDFWASVHLATPRDGAMLLEEHYVHNASRRHRLPGTLS
jgi:small subunit ribosomal protein S1